MNQNEESIELFLKSIPDDLRNYIYIFLRESFSEIKEILDGIFLPSCYDFLDTKNILNLHRFSIYTRNYNNFSINLPKNFIEDNTLRRQSCCTYYPDRFFIYDEDNNDKLPEVIMSLFIIKFNKTGNFYIPCLIIYPNGNIKTCNLPYSSSDLFDT